MIELSDTSNMRKFFNILDEAFTMTFIVFFQLFEDARYYLKSKI